MWNPGEQKLNSCSKLFDLKKLKNSALKSMKRFHGSTLQEAKVLWVTVEIQVSERPAQSSVHSMDNSHLIYQIYRKNPSVWHLTVLSFGILLTKIGILLVLKVDTKLLLVERDFLFKSWEKN